VVAALFVSNFAVNSSVLAAAATNATATVEYIDSVFRTIWTSPAGNSF